jgi:hypothetical protein
VEVVEVVMAPSSGVTQTESFNLRRRPIALRKWTRMQILQVDELILGVLR